MLQSLPSAIDDALDTLYEPNAVFSHFLGSAGMTFLSLFLTLLPLVLYFLAFLVFFFLFFPFILFLFFVSFFQSTCVCRAYA